ncbi:MAG: CpsD/CapB family tyrosine-protein kinase [Candidatus Sulfotelmatobacter sp.]|jgi:protein-tyrosine kinase
MSRNFELLQKIGREQTLYTTTAEEPIQEMEPPPVVVPVGSRLEIEGAELEEITKVVQRVFLLPGNDSPRTVVFAGTEPGNGCSWVCARVAEVLAGQVSGTVCLVDANLRSPGLNAQFAAENAYGLTDALRKREPIRSFAQPLSCPRLWLVSSGSAAEDGQSLLSSDRMRQRMTELRAEFDYVLIDTPAISSSNDATVLGAATDGLVVVLKANSSRRESARGAMQDLRAAKVRVLGAVLNQRTFPIPQSIYDKL